MKEIYIVWTIFMWKVTVGVEKFWLPNLQWENPENWVGKRIPESDDYVTFPVDMRHAAGIGISENLRLSGINLAKSGALVLARNGRLQLSEHKSGSSEWARSGHVFWADPQNWNGSSKAAPHLEQVPCRQDDIVLPEATYTFSALLPMKNIEVRSVRTSDEKRPFSQWQWLDFENKREFRKRLTVNYAEYSCNTCPCQDDPNGYYLEEVCAIERPKCGFTPCEFPLKVEGHCCRYCGGRVSLTNKASMSVVRQAVNEALERYAEILAWHVRYAWSGAVEILIKEKDDYREMDILKATDNVKETLQNMKIEVVSTETAGAAVKDHRLAVTLIPLFGTPFLILIVLFIGFLYFGYTYGQIALGCTEFFSSIRDGVRADKSQTGKSFSFARFENVPEGNIQIASVAGVRESDAEEKELPSGGRFENPLYRSKKRQKQEMEVLNMDAPLSLATLRDKVESQEEVEIDVDQ